MYVVASARYDQALNPLQLQLSLVLLYMYFGSDALVPIVQTTLPTRYLHMQHTQVLTL